MTFTKHMENIVKQLRNAIPEGVKEVPKDLEKKFKSILSGTFSKFDFVTREEFEVQVAVLQRTRKKLEELEKHLKASETPKRPKPKKTPGPHDL
ncbi:MAG: accessory factor UbiK family protein [Gammaproteobacteria bacterium]